MCSQSTVWRRPVQGDTRLTRWIQVEKAIRHISGSASAFLLDPELAGYENKRTLCTRSVNRVDQMDDWTVLLFTE